MYARNQYILKKDLPLNIIYQHRAATVVTEAPVVSTANSERKQNNVKATIWYKRIAEYTAHGARELAAIPLQHDDKTVRQLLFSLLLFSYMQIWDKQEEIYILDADSYGVGSKYEMYAFDVSAAVDWCVRNVASQHSSESFMQNELYP